MDTNKLQEILVKHKMYLNGEQGGVRANLCGVDLGGVNLRGVDLRNADLRGAYLRKVILSNADLTEADLTGANISSANLIDAKLMGANLRGVNLNCVDLTYADLRNANLENADLLGAKLYGAVGIISFGPIGKFSRIGYAVKHDNAIMVQLGCFWGTLAEARVAIQNKYGENSTYAALVIAAANALLL